MILTNRRVTNSSDTHPPSSAREAGRRCTSKPLSALVYKVNIPRKVREGRLFLPFIVWAGLAPGHGSFSERRALQGIWAHNRGQPTGGVQHERPHRAW